MQENYQTHSPPQQLQLVSTTTLESESTQKPRQEITGHKCIKCGVTLTSDNWYKCLQKSGNRKCKECCKKDATSRLNNLSDAQYLWELARQRARANGREFTISIEDVERVDTDICPLMEIPINRYPTVPNRKYTINPDAKSLDRIDANKGYTPDNIRVISWAANKMLGNFSLFDLAKVANNALRLKYEESVS